MKSAKKVKVILISLIFLFTLSQVPGAGTILAQEEEGIADWTLMIYLDGDNNLYSMGLCDINEMESAELSPRIKINVVVLFDGPREGDTRILRITSDEDVWEIHSPAIEDSGKVIKDYESNMGDPRTLIDFANWCMEEYPAKRYGLILWDHGSGFSEYERGGSKGAVSEEKEKEDNRVKVKVKELPTTTLTLKGICWDNTDGDYLSTPELKKALRTITKYGTKKIELIGFDACLMAMVELFYETCEYANYAVASQQLEPGEGWDYQGAITCLSQNTSMDGKELATGIVQSYHCEYGEIAGLTLSAVDLSLIPPLADSIDELSGYLIENISNYADDIEKLREEVQEFDCPQYIDLCHFATLLNTGIIEDEQISERTSKVDKLVTEAVIAETHSKKEIIDEPVQNAHGISIYFPEQEWEYLRYYDGKSKFLSFTAEHNWDEFLRCYYNYNALIK